MNKLNKLNQLDTITAIAAPAGGAIAVIRLSGNQSLHILQAVFSKKPPYESHRIYYGYILDNLEKIDEVLVSVMLAPKSFTREDVVEIHCHGGNIVVSKILRLLSKHGARLAEPGEFTKRAFLNGRINLAEAEAVMDIISAKSELASRTAASQLSGGFGDSIDRLCDILLNLLARIEMAIDYPEHEEAEILHSEILRQILDISEKLQKLLITTEHGRLIREGIKTAIIGHPNVGKSSLLNAILQENRAIVTDIPGTTRDVLREYIRIGDIFLHIADTAGIRQSANIVERIGVDLSYAEKDKADLVLLVLDASENLKTDELKSFRINDWRHTIVILNKIDLTIRQNMDEIYNLSPAAIVEISASQNIGLDALYAAIHKIFFDNNMQYGDEIVTNMRHITALQNAKVALQNAEETISSGLPIDLVAIDLQGAYASLGEITGIVVEESLIDRIFSEFCLGK